MAYKYFSKQIIDKNFDLNTVFPEKQTDAQKKNGVSYNLLDIVIYLQEVTNNFVISDNAYVDMDNAIEMVVNDYFKVHPDLVNPFVVKEKEDKKFLENKIPKDAVILTEDSVKSKGNSTKAASTAKVKVGEEVEVEPEAVIEVPVDNEIEPVIEVPVEPEITLTDDELRERFIEDADFYDQLGEDALPEEKEQLEGLILTLHYLNHEWKSKIKKKEKEEEVKADVEEEVKPKIKSVVKKTTKTKKVKSK